MLDPNHRDTLVAGQLQPGIPAYLEKTYWWAYLRPASIRIFDKMPVVSAILWGQYKRLCNAVLTQIRRDDRVLQLACVYGDLSERIAHKIGIDGRLDVVDIAPIQIGNLRDKLDGLPQVAPRIGNAADPQPDQYDRVLCFFLLHELPDPLKSQVVNAALDAVLPGGQAIFVDYARPAAWHPLRPVMAIVFALLEPFARAMWRKPIRALVGERPGFVWQRTSSFGGLYQTVLVTRANTN